MAGNGLDLQKLFAMQAQLKKDNPPLEGVKREMIEVAYLKKDGSKDVRPVRLNIPPKAKAPMPLIFVPHYEMKEDALEIRDYLLKGWAVASCAEFKNEYNAELTYDDLVFNNAALYALRKRGDIDNDRIAVVGGSAGGYMTMMLSALQLGICCSNAGAPPLNAYFNFYKYFEEAVKYVEEAIEKLPEEERKNPVSLITKTPLPFVAAICYSRTFTKHLDIAIGDANDMKAWEAVSPTAFYACYSNPVYITWATSDLLVPIDQLTRKFTYSEPGKTLPAGYNYRMGEYEGVLGKPFCDLVDPEKLNLFKVPPVDGDDVVSLPFDQGKLFNVCVTDEGAPEAYASHNLGTHTGRSSDVDYLEYMLSRGAHKTNILPPEKLLLFAERYAGKAKQLIAHEGEGVYGTLAVYREEIEEELKKWKEDNGAEALERVFCETAALCPEYAQTLQTIAERM